MGYSFPLAPPSLTLVALLALFGCGPTAPDWVPPDAGREDAASGGSYDLEFGGTGYDAEDGLAVHLALTSAGTADVRRTASVQGASFTFTLADVLEHGTQYSLHWYVDLDADGLCSDPPLDEAWSLDLGVAVGDVVVNQPREGAMDGAACRFFDSPKLTFDLTLRGHGFEPHNSQTLRAAVVQIQAQVADAVSSAVVAQGAFEIRFPGSLRDGTSYFVDFYADVDRDGACDSLVDSAWRIDLLPISSDVVLEETRSDGFEPMACASF